MNRILILLTTATIIASCNKKSEKPDAFGNFEAIETLVSSETSGKIQWLSIDEGSAIKKNQTVGLIDTIMPTLQLNEIQAQGYRIKANIKSIDSQSEILKQQKENIAIDLKRIKNMINSGAATQKQLDDAIGGLKVIAKQIDANETQKAAIASELTVIRAKKLIVIEQLNRCKIKNPINGVVLEKYAEPGEITAAGKPLYKIADVENIILRAYVPGSMLHKVLKGQTCKVLIDKGKKDNIEYEGKITWISNQAEFTPKIIQTKEERVSMVYAIKINVKNDGSIKIGMPGEVIF